MAEIQRLGSMLQVASAAGMQVATVHRHLPAVPSFTPDMVPAGLMPSVESAALLICSQQPAVSRMATTDLIEDLFEPLSMVPFLLGHSNTLLSGKDLLVLSTAVAEMVQRDFPALKLMEISAALRQGCSGKWKGEKDILQCSLPQIAGWLRSYQLSQRAPALKVLQACAEQRLQLPPPDLSAGFPRQVAELAAWASGNATPEHPIAFFPEPLDQGNVLYNWLKKVGAFNGFKTPAQYVDMRRKEAILRAQRPPQSMDDYRHGRSFWDLLRAGKWPENHPFADSVVNACRKRLLRDWIKYHLSIGTDIEQHLHQLRDNYRHRQSSAA
ncbi:hypothetical protein [Hymenobacter sp. YC55]|uniref:hypothetical protein n=1 Tax=Hymenobacter sp. YC55 TaxID=3034019 RepID=UPI0023F67BAF|nr:hypothetical protein [Hymenobacter sp. YC55]MDF7809943.1 hypothetical protein [Hymenobacter sp. YC55]